MGLLLALEGIDGSGKGTQAARLAEIATRAGYRVASFTFPRYDDNPFSVAIAAYLNGELGALDEVHPSLSALLYACDRLHARPELVGALAGNDLVVCDRYVASNLAHQGSRLEGAARTQLLEWIEAVEYGEFDLPRPDLVVLLDAPPDLARELVGRKGARGYTTLEADILESSSGHGDASRAIYRELAASGGWLVVDAAAADGTLRAVDEIAGEIWAAVEPRLEALA
jgi:dTMP kinase